MKIWNSYILCIWEVMKMLFSEVYSNYYHAIASVLDAALDKPISYAQICKIVEEKAFAESNGTIPTKLSSEGEWPLLDKKGMAIINKETYMPLTTLQKRWLKTLLSDPRIKLFNPDPKGLEDVEPLFGPDDFVHFDQFMDGDSYEDEKYIENFRKILSAIKSQKSIRIRYQQKSGDSKWKNCNPIRLEYSLRDDKFRLFASIKSKSQTFNLSKIEECEIGDKFRDEELKTEFHNKRTVEFLIKDDRQALERVMMQFSIYEKVTERLDDVHYSCILTYEAEDEADIIIRVLSFGPNLKVVGPDTFVNQIKNRLEMQKSCGR